MYQSDELSRHPKYNTTLDTAVFVHGFHNTENTGLVKDMCEGFVLHNKKYNMLTLDWDYFALLDYYEVAAPIIKEVKVKRCHFSISKKKKIIIRFSVW